MTAGEPVGCEGVLYPSKIACTMAAGLRQLVEGGQYASTSEIVREALRECVQRRDEELRDLQAPRAAVTIGDESGPSISAEEVFAELRQMIAKRRAARW